MASYAILQKELVPPDVEGMKRSMRVLDHLTEYDAWAMLRDAFGVLAERLTAGDARQLAAAMNAEGLDVVAVPESELFPLPPARRVRQIDPFDSGMVVHDQLDRQRVIPWENLIVVAVGQVRSRQVRTVTRVVSDGPSLPGLALSGGLGLPMSGGDVYSETTITEEHSDELRMDIITVDEPQRIYIEGTGTRYSGLGARMTQNAAVNFMILCDMVLQRASTAVLNQGAVTLGMGEGETYAYPSLRAFEEEMVWQIWRAQQPDDI